MRGVSGATPEEVFAKRAAFPTNFAQRQEFRNLYDALTDLAFVNTLLDRYGLPQITTPNPQNPEGVTKVTLTRAELISRRAVAGTQALTRAQVLRAVVESNEVGAAEFNRAFVAMQYYGYLRRAPEDAGYQSWLRVINQDPNNVRVMVNGFMNSKSKLMRLRHDPEMIHETTRNKTGNSLVFLRVCSGGFVDQLFASVPISSGLI